MMAGKRKGIIITLLLLLVLSGWLSIEKHLLSNSFVYNAQLDTPIRQYDGGPAFHVNTISALSRLNIHRSSVDHNHSQMTASYETWTVSGKKLVDQNADFRLERSSWKRLDPRKPTILLFAPHESAQKPFFFKPITLRNVIEMQLQEKETIEAPHLVRDTGHYRSQNGKTESHVQSGSQAINLSDFSSNDQRPDIYQSFQSQWNNVESRIMLLPSPSYLDKFHSLLPDLTLVIGIFCSILVGVSIWLYRDRNRKLKEINIEIKAKEIAQKRLEKLIAHSPNGILLVDGAAKILLINNAIKNMFGYTGEELIDQNVELLIPGRFRHQHRLFLSEFINDPTPRKMGEGREVFGVRKSGEEFPVEIGLTPIKVDADIQIICSIVDISKIKSNAQKLLKTQDALMNLLIDTKQAQIALENKQNELKATNKELEQFAYVASHDLQEPLRKLTSFSQLLLQDAGTELNENARKDLFYIQDSAERMRALVQDLLALSHAGMSALSISEYSIDAIVDDVLSILSSAIAEVGANIIRTPLPNIQCDRRLMTQLYQNLISNALKFVPPGTTPQIEITLERQHDERLVFGVKDNGIGIKPQHRERIFMPFKRLHSTKEYKGTGIGLSICKKAVERHGGSIWVESGDTGSHFKFTFGQPS